MPTDADTAAQQVLADLWADAFGQIRIPVDPIKIARDLGLDVYTASLNPGVSGVLVKRGGQSPQIYLSDSDAAVRQRFTCGHEIGHFIHRRGRGDADFGYIDNRGTLASAGTDIEEIFANRFAASLLMPASLLQIHRQRHHETELARMFWVSVEALRNRIATVDRDR
jgi:hypothetical protein